MKFSNQELKMMASRAMDLFERFSAKPASRTPGKQATERLKRWQQSVTGDNHAGSFHWRLSLNGLKEKNVLPYLDDVKLPDGAPVPEWTALLAEILKEPTGKSCRNVLIPKFRIPFEELLLPFVSYGRRRLEPTRKKVKLLSPTAWKGLEWGLLWRLTGQTTLAFWHRYQIFLTSMNPLAFIQTEARPKGAKPPRGHYQAFVKKFWDGEWKKFLEEYPVLGRMLVTITQQWIAATQEFCARLESDLPEIEKTILGGKKAGKIIGLNSGLSDPHHGGKTVIRIEFASRKKLIYKPKNLDTEKGFYALLGWLNETGVSPEFKTRNVVGKKDYGWIEYIETPACKNGAQIRRFYERAGMLLGLVYLLDGTDGHSENVLACGEYPVLIDAETLFQPTHKVGLKLEEESLDFSVLRTGMLPIWQAGREGKSYDTSSLAASKGQGTGYKMPRWKFPNSDWMELYYGDSILSDPQSTPKLGKRAISVENHVDEVVRGFEKLYRFVMKHRKKFQNKNGPLKLFSTGEVRTIYRPTYVYALLHYRLIHPDFLQNGVDRSIEIEALTRNLTAERNKKMVGMMLAAYESERRSMERLDIPCFSNPCAGTALHADGVKIAGDFFREPSLSQVKRRLQLLSEKELAYQVGTIRASLKLRFARGPEESGAATENVKKWTAAKSLSSKEFTAEALALAREIESSATRIPGGGVTWITAGFEPTTEKLKLMSLEDSLYDGRSGIPLFLGALFQKTGNRHWRDLALEVLKPLRQKLHNPPQRLALVRQRGIGGCVGAGGFLYSLAAAGKLLEEKSLIKEARDLARNIPSSAIEQDAVYDVTGGAAGLILGLLAVTKSFSADKTALKKAVTAGEHLLAHRTAAPSGHRAWKMPEGAQPLTGFSHGAAGYALALLRLYEASGKNHFLEAALEAIDYERTVYLADKKNWPDFRSFMMKEGEPPACGVKWCHGAPGIGLARTATLGILNDVKVRKEIEAAAHTTRAAELHPYDYLCCGNFGRIELLLEAGKKLNRPEWIEEARLQATAAIRRSRRTRGYSLYAAADHVLRSPSFYQGLSGIGYQLLRLAGEELPSALAFEI